MATNIIAFPRLYVTPEARSERRVLEEQRLAAWAKLGTPHEYAGTGFAAFMALQDDLVPKTRDDMVSCLFLFHAETLARRLDDDAREQARQMRQTLAAAMA